MEQWLHSDVTHRRMESLVKHGLLHVRTMVMEWLMPESEDMPTPPNGYVVSFIPFHERGLASPPHRFF
jgi:hypothetical protein